jgi:signal transduction histidine kinase/DNA-binding LacI/PurR family transcriptional regulator
MANQFQPNFTTTLGSKAARPTIGVLRSNYVGNFNAIQWNGLVDAARKLDVNLICYSGDLLNYWNTLERDSSSVVYDLAGAERLDGLIICTGSLNWNTPPDQVAQFVKSYVPLPVVSAEVAIEGIPSLVWNDFEGMCKVVTHLIEVHHCKRIAFISGNENQDCMMQRYRGYLHALEKYGIAFDRDLVWTYQLFYNGQKQLDRLADHLTSSRIDAVAVCNDAGARRLINLMQFKGLPAIPVVGFDDEIESRAGKWSLTTVRAPFYEIGYRAVEVMLKMLENKPVKQLECLPCAMVIRRSCGCDPHAVTRDEIRNSMLVNNSVALNDRTRINSGEFAKLVTGLVKFRKKVASRWAQKLLEAFLSEVQENGAPIFMSYLEMLFNQTIKDGTETDLWQDIILTLHFFTKPFIMQNGYDLAKAERLSLTAMMLITKLTTHSEIASHNQQLSSIFEAIKYNDRLSEAFDLNTTLKKLRIGLIQLRISSCYLSLYENPALPTGQARLILAFDVNSSKVIKPEEAVFPARQLVPKGLLFADKQVNYVLRSLCFRNYQIGFVLFEADQHNLSIFEMLSNTISVSLYTGILVGKLENQAAELSKANADLEGAYQSLQDNQQKLLISEQMASLGRLTAGIAHEMNTPLAAVRVAIKELKDLTEEYQNSIRNPQVLPEDHLAIAADMSKQLKLAEQAAEKSAAFIRGIKAQTLDMKFSNLQLFNAAFAISDALNVLEFAIRKGFCTLVTSLDDSIQLYGDPRKLVQIIINLVMNSIAACQPDGGTITVRLTKSGNEFAELIVEDTGCGIAPEIITKIFDPMFTTKPFGEGTGLGLSIVHELVNKYQGSIKVNSQKGLTLFIITLPLKKEESLNG